MNKSKSFSKFLAVTTIILLLQPIWGVAANNPVEHSSKKRRISTKDLSPEDKEFLKKFKSSGIYQFTDQNGEPYIGRSNNATRRLKEHIRSGKLPIKEIRSIKLDDRFSSQKGQTAPIKLAEKTRIKVTSILNNGKIGNKQHNDFGKSKKSTSEKPVAPSRSVAPKSTMGKR